MECVGYSGDSRPRSQWTCHSCSPYSKASQNIPLTSSDTHIPPDIISKIEDKIVTAIRQELQNIIRKVLASELQPIKEQLQLLEGFNTLPNNHLLSDVEIVGIPEHRNEDTNIIIKKNCNVVGFSFPSPQDIIFTTRVAKINRESKRPRNLVCQFSNKLVRDNFLAAIINYNKSHKDNKLSSSLLGITGSSVPVYVNEHLTPANISLHAETRKLAKTNGYKFVWVRSRKIFIRKEETSPAKNILSSEHLHQLFKQQ
ncbi:unnamed protein product [Leptidea sinapis]|uniref:FP protein C-terminal domain-containing protein n=1 Tax=Leptidea sinapis TaxID=189913 RepID=A0A5E4Q6I5_9NEOP|nr:unnamed protein product [Leptidea sinapis]